MSALNFSRFNHNEETGIAQLLHAAAQGDEAAREAFVEWLREWLIGFINLKKWSVPGKTTEDIAHDCIVRLQKRQIYLQYDPQRGSLVSWLTLIVNRTLIDILRLDLLGKKHYCIQQQVAEAEFALLEETGKTPTWNEIADYTGLSVEDILEAQDNREINLLTNSGECTEILENIPFTSNGLENDPRWQLVREAMRELPEKDRLIIEHIHLSGYAHEWVAQNLDLKSAGASRVALHRAMIQLKKVVNDIIHREEGTKEETIATNVEEQNPKLQPRKPPPPSGIPVLEALYASPQRPEVASS